MTHRPPRRTAPFQRPDRTFQPPPTVAGWLDDDDFDAQRFAHGLLLAVARPTDALVVPGVLAPRAAAAHLRLTGEADAIGMPLHHPRVALVRRWIDMAAGVAASSAEVSS